MGKKALILIEGHRNSGPLYLRAAQQLGLDTITLSADPAQYNYLAEEGVQAVRVDTNNLDALMQQCVLLNETSGIAGITGFSGENESVYATVGKLCRAFNFPGPNPDAVERCSDKFTQREILRDAGVPMPGYRLAADSAEVQKSAAEIGLPVIVKPAVGSGSSGVRLCRDVNELIRHADYLSSRKYPWPSSPRILVEEFAQGPSYNAEIMGSDIIGLTESEFATPAHFIYHQWSFPALLKDSENQLIANLSLDCLRALGLGWGPTNIEFRWTDVGPVLIEVNPRLSGAPGPQLVQLACGLDPIAEHIKLVVGDEWNLDRKHSQTAAVRFLTADVDGILDWIEGDRLAAALPGVHEVKLHVEPKTPIVSKGDWRDCIGHVIAASPTLAATEVIIQRATGLINWSITPFSASSEREQTEGSYPTI
ncbi:acetyl-CoA carboxylase biotin carboxylase subunit family protein [Mesorhizobium salmacidum]|uniref:Acetyl-CoA carboxylase biotin carboxylase subunit family protein n=1 Tax=Mesorhizobium salmacidum TaxID=3015171 RepID=A0ABU8L7S6_9HYPH